MDDPLSIERCGTSAVLTIDRADAGNSISAEVVAALEAFFDEAADDSELRAVVITGAGDRFFAAGGDVKRCRGSIAKGCSKYFIGGNIDKEGRVPCPVFHRY